MGWDTDPYEEYPDETLWALSAFFSQQMSLAHALFPQAQFIRWVTESRSKCQNECMVLYSLLALGTVFTGASHPFAKLCVERATKAVDAKFAKFSIALVQSRMFLSFYNHAKGRDSPGWELSGGSVRALLAENLNTEEGCINSNNRFGLDRNLFGLSDEQMVESKRRTFWAVFLLDVSAQSNSGWKGSLSLTRVLANYVFLCWTHGRYPRRPGLSPCPVL